LHYPEAKSGRRRYRKLLNFSEALRAQLAARPAGFRAEWDARPAAVLVPLYRDDGEWHLLLTERTHAVEDHKGQVAFPGGRVDPGDVDRTDTALREAEEEVGLKREHVTVLGQLDELVTVSQYRITPVVGVFAWPYPFALSTTELSEVFGVPLRWLADPTHLETRQRHPLIPGRPIDVYYFHYPNHTVWGITARIILNLLEVARPLL
jgi:8-oxo-dGTP pyrophosphatase MutT (NUDIX family)